MSRLPVIVGFGGYNTTGRSSFHHGFRHMVIESMDPQTRQGTLAGLTVMMKLVKAEGGHHLAEDGTSLPPEDIEQRYTERIFVSTLVQRVEPQYPDPDAVHRRKVFELSPAEDQTLTFKVSPKQLSGPLSANWSIAPVEDDEVLMSIHGRYEFEVDSYHALTVKSASQLSTGFEPSEPYNSRSHPRGLRTSVVAATDAIRPTGIDWKTIVDSVQPDEIAILSGNIMSQLDDNGFDGLIQSRLRGHRTLAKQLPLGPNSVPTGFINTYMLGSIGMTGSTIGTCATSLYNLRKGINVTTSGQAWVVIVGDNEAPILSECIEGYNAMSALATEEDLRLIGGRDGVDFHHAGRPFGKSCGPTLAESSQCAMLTDNGLVLHLDAGIHGVIASMFADVDGFRKSISAPDPGSYLTAVKAVASAVQIVGLDATRHASFIHAHGSSTPTNRVIESKILDRVANTFGTDGWPVTAARAYVGYSLVAASADQLISVLDTFKYGTLPGVKTIDKTADDVYQRRLSISNRDMYRDKPLEVYFINSKDLDSNNADGMVLSPRIAERILHERHGEATFIVYVEKCGQARTTTHAYDQRALQGNLETVYNFNQNLAGKHVIEVSAEQATVPDFDQPLVYKEDTRLSDIPD